MSELTIDISTEAIDAFLSRLEADRWLDAKEASTYLSTPLSTLYKLTSRKVIPFSQDSQGGKLYFKKSDLDRWRRGND